MATPVDFVGAIVNALNANVACAAAFGAAPNKPKFAGTQNFRPDMPYARLWEVTADPTFQSEASDGLTYFMDRGTLQIDIFADDESVARSLGKLIAKVINDGAFVFQDGNMLEIRQSRAFFVPEPDSGIAGVAIVYHRVYEFLYVIQRNI